MDEVCREQRLRRRAVCISLEEPPGIAARTFHAYEENAPAVPVEVHGMDGASVLVELALLGRLVAETGKADQRGGPVRIDDEVVVAREIWLCRVIVPSRIAAAMLHGENGQIPHQRMRGQKTALAHDERLCGNGVPGGKRRASSLLLALRRLGERPHCGDVLRIGAWRLGPVVRKAFQRFGIYQLHLRSAFLQNLLRHAMCIKARKRDERDKGRNKDTELKIAFHLLLMTLLVMEWM